MAASESERRELNQLFEALCRIESPSGREQACAQRITDELRALDLKVMQDDVGASVASDCGNVLARIPATAANGDEEQSGPVRTVLLCAHMDTVPLSAPVEPVLVDDAWENTGAGILGADNKAAVAVILAVARRVVTEGLPLELELLFTVGEERALAGARAFDRAQLRSEFGYVFDHATPIGEVIVASPSQYRLEATFHGAAAHAGMHPEKGRSAIVAAARAVSAMRLGRLDEETTANIGEIGGGTAMNVVPERCSLVGEARSLSDEKVDGVVSEMVDRIHDAANLPECECDVDVSVQRMFQGYRVAQSEPALATAERALRRCGYEPRRIASGGAADANVFQVDGRSVINLANGTERAHEPTERVTVAALESMLDVVLTLVDEAAR